jgi:hypothetical protein
MDATKCIENTKWEAYSQGQLNSKELAQLAGHVADCEICADIKEGIDAMNKPSTLVENVQSIDKKIDKKTKKSYAKIIAITAIVAVAATLLIIGNGFLLMQAEDATIHPILSEKITDANDSVQTETKKILALESPPKKAKKLVKPYSPTPEESIEIEPATNTDMPAQIEDRSVQTESLSPQTEDDNSAEVDLVKALPVATKEEVKLQNRDVQKVTTSSKKQKSRAAGPQISNNNNNNNTNLASEVVNSYSQDSVRIELAKQLLAAGAYQNGLNALLRVRNDSKSVYYYEALYLSAQLYIGLNQANLSVGLLQEILKTENSFNQKAKVLLETLKKD